ncbi:hypothetical protein C8R46DRAFT_1046459 [Mycena filopes]|nr:hypothetical protein C8R46DRAFT_1046459 [Mycena filopes]
MKITQLILAANRLATIVHGPDGKDSIEGFTRVAALTRLAEHIVEKGTPPSPANLPYTLADTEISVVDTWALANLVGSDATKAIILTAPPEAFRRGLPVWYPDIEAQIEGGLDQFNRPVAARSAALNQKNNTRQMVVLMEHALEHSVNMLGVKDPMAQRQNAQAVVLLTAMFCWWPRSIIGVDPSAYDAILRRAEEAVRRKQNRDTVVAMVKSRGKQGNKDIPDGCSSH